MAIVGTIGPIPRFCRAVEGIAGRADVRLTHLSVNTHINDDAMASDALAGLLEMQTSLEHVVMGLFEVAGSIGQRLPLLPLLRYLEVSTNFEDVTEMEVFFENVARGCPLLETLRIEMDAASEELLGRALQFQILLPLLQARAIKVLGLYVQYETAIVLQEADVTAMGKAWPKMEDLTISASVPVSTLSAFAGAFSSTLKHLTLAFTFPSTPTFDTLTPRFSSLENLSISVDVSLPPEMVPGVAAFLAWVCPATTVINMPGGKASKQWTKVKQIVDIGHKLQGAAVDRDRRDR